MSVVELGADRAEALEAQPFTLWNGRALLTARAPE
jgi:hypothetical protein